MTWVKLCGLRTRADVVAAVEAGADAVGFVVASGSARRVTLSEAARLGAGIDAERYLVTVDLDPEVLVAAARAASVTGVQPHGRHGAAAAAAARDAGFDVLLPVPVRDEVDVASVPEGVMPILDASPNGQHGGSGVAFDWRLAEGLGRPVVLAGGLTPENVADAVAIVRPWGVDVSSGIETVPGVKDHDRMRRFVEAVK
jgi:phosphoribosylanthranilate isomerase